MLLECRDVIKTYIDTRSNIKVRALQGIDLSVDEGELVTLIGKSGSGKSTLISLIGGIDKPTSGEVIVENKVINKFSEKELSEYRLKKVGFLYQSPERNLLWNLTAKQNVLFPMKFNDSLPLSLHKKRAIELLSQVGLEKRLNHKPSQLSGGEAQRVGLAVALANDPKIILADEPTGELDSVNTFKIIEFVHKLNEELGKTFIVVTHDHRFSNLTKKLIRILDGRIIV